MPPPADIVADATRNIAVGGGTGVVVPVAEAATAVS